jgi:hypothetical protein
MGLVRGRLLYMRQLLVQVSTSRCRPMKQAGVIHVHDCSEDEQPRYIQQANPHTMSHSSVSIYNERAKHHENWGGSPATQS